METRAEQFLLCVLALILLVGAPTVVLYSGGGWIGVLVGWSVLGVCFCVASVTS